jgi:DNA-binding HxlR family transcriptional regulator
MKSKSFAGMACSIAGALELIGDRWSFLILRDLFLGLGRHDEFLHSTGVPPTTLSNRLKHLEKAGIITRKAYQDHPPRFAYQLTEKGRKASPIIMALAQWGDTVDAAGRGSAPVEFRDRQNGQPVEIAVVSKKSGRKVPSGRLVAVPGKGADDLVHWRLGKGGR